MLIKKTIETEHLYHDNEADAIDRVMKFMQYKMIEGEEDKLSYKKTIPYQSSGNETIFDKMNRLKYVNFEWDKKKIVVSTPTFYPIFILVFTSLCLGVFTYNLSDVGPSQTIFIFLAIVGFGYWLIHFFIDAMLHQIVEQIKEMIE